MSSKKRSRKKKVELRKSEVIEVSGSSLDGLEEWWNACFDKYPGLFSPLNKMADFVTIFKIHMKTFDYICSLVLNKMTSRPFEHSIGTPLSIYDQVAIALRRLSSGDSFVAVSEIFGTTHSTVSQITWRFVEALEEKGIHHLQWPSTQQKIDNIKLKFEKISGLPNCCGAIDITHVVMLLPSSDSQTEVWLDRAKNHSMILQAIVGPDMKFLDVVTGWPGYVDDKTTLINSEFYNLCEAGKRLNGAKIVLCKGAELGEYIVGGSGYPLFPWLMTPYQGNNLKEAEIEFNRKHMITRMVAQRALAGLKEKWRIIKKSLWRPDRNKLPRIILACCILHNIELEIGGDDALDEIPLSPQHEDGYEQDVCDVKEEEESTTLRERLAIYLSRKN